MRESIQTLLGSLKGLEPLKRLFWQELNYDRANQSVSTRSWTDAEREELDGDPLLLAEHNEFKILYLRMRGELSRTAERSLINRLLQPFPYALFVFSDRSQSRWHFVNVKYERDPKRRRVFRRITVVAGNDQLRTATERLTMLDLETVSRDLFGIPPLAIQQRHDQAFDVEAVTREFFREYDKVFKRAEAQLTILPEERRRLFTQRLFNRLMFLVFLERKNWLTFKGRTDYLRALWEDYTHTRQQTDQGNFYWNRLYPLFFNGLNYPYDLRITKGSYLYDLIGDVPYLNGGLFERDDDDDNRNILISDEIFRTAIDDLFYRFNFTIAESTPLDIEVAVDPEMLGKIFEELVTGRHETGSYYTPKQVVSFMCHEALKGYLRNKLPGEAPEAIARFVDEYDATLLRDAETVLQALQNVTVCDPACGSGAYLLGMLQELLQLRLALLTVHNVDQRTTYDRKRQIIQNNIHGVDRDPFATNIAQLRLWLSLIVDYERGREGFRPPTLPNFDYKIEAGDSLLGPDPSGALQPDLFRHQMIADYSRLKKEYGESHGEEKQRLHTEIEQLKAEIRTWARSEAQDAIAFDWAVEFAEVFDDGGFDIVLANPPYIDQRLLTRIKPELRRVYGNFYSGTADLYTYFYARALQLLRTGGMLVFISSNKWMRVDYGANLRGLLAQNTRLETVIDFGDLPVFGAVAYPVIIAAQKDVPSDGIVRVLTPKTLDRIDDLRSQVDDEAINIETSTLSHSSWSFGDMATRERLGKVRAAGLPLRNYLGGRVYRGISTGLNEAFVINGATRAALIMEDPNSLDIIKSFLRGRDVKRWRVQFADQYILRIAYGDTLKLMGYDSDKINASRRRSLVNKAEGDGTAWRMFSATYPAIAEYIQQFEHSAKQRSDKGDFWWELRPCDYYSVFETPKIVSTKISVRPTFILDTQGYYIGNTAYAFASPNDGYYILGILNSNIFLQYAKEVFSGKQNDWYEIQPRGLEDFPIPEASASERSTIEVLVHRCIDKGGIACEEEEREIDVRVASLYGFKDGTL